jgi:hypothetical protein
MFFLLGLLSCIDEVRAHSLCLLFLDEVQDACCSSDYDKVVGVVCLEWHLGILVAHLYKNDKTIAIPPYAIKL